MAACATLGDASSDAAHDAELAESAAMTDLESRLCRLERSAGRWRLGCVAACAVLAALVVGGCQTAPNLYQSYYSSTNDLPRKSVARAEVRYEHVSDMLKDAQAPGYTLIGSSSFYGPGESDGPGDPSHGAQRVSRKIGADMLRWGRELRSQETVIAQQPVRTRSFGQAGAFGQPGAVWGSGVSTTYVPYETTVDIFNYLTYYYRKIEEPNK